MSDQEPNPARKKNHFGKGRAHDWKGYMQEWLGTTETLHEFKVRKNIRHNTTFYKVVKEMGWVEAREKIKDKAMAKAGKAAVENLAKKYGFQHKLWCAVEGMAARILKRINTRSAKAGDDNALADAVTMSELESLTKVLERALKSQKLIAGEPTGEGAGAAQGAQITHHTVVQLIQMVESGDPSVLHPGPAAIPGEVVREAPKKPEKEPR
jgi:hypothetical protein